MRTVLFETLSLDLMGKRRAGVGWGGAADWRNGRGGFSPSLHMMKGEKKERKESAKIQMKVEGGAH